MRSTEAIASANAGHAVQTTADTTFTLPALALCNAMIVLETGVLHGTLIVENGRITDIIEGTHRDGLDMNGDYLLPGLVELHTDHLERHYSPRPGVRWPMTSAIQAHDSQIASSGITTVFDCLRMGSDDDSEFQPGEMRQLADALRIARHEGRLRADHRLHLRCEVSASDVLMDFNTFDTDQDVAMVSLMDHAPGQRQFASMEQYALYYQGTRGFTDAQFADFVARRKGESAQYANTHRNRIAAACRVRGIPMASHDDATRDHVDEALALGVGVAEFPTSRVAASRARECGLHILMGAPNVIRGGSHSGNIAAHELAEAGELDLLSSDYVPMSLIHAPFTLSDTLPQLDLASAVRLVTANPAQAVGLSDRGRIKRGLRADLVRVQRRTPHSVPVVRSVWREGERVV